VKKRLKGEGKGLNPQQHKITLRGDGGDLDGGTKGAELAKKKKNLAKRKPRVGVECWTRNRGSTNILGAGGSGHRGRADGLLWFNWCWGGSDRLRDCNQGGKEGGGNELEKKNEVVSA